MGRPTGAKQTCGKCGGVGHMTKTCGRGDANERERAKRKAALAAGMCGQCCNAPVITDKRRCVECTKAHNDRYHRKVDAVQFRMCQGGCGFRIHKSLGKKHCAPCLAVRIARARSHGPFGQTVPGLVLDIDEVLGYGDIEDNYR